MRILILGGAGMLARDLADGLAGREVALLSRSEADVTDVRAVCRAVARFEPAVVFNCAAATDVDRCQREPEWAYRVNAWGAWAAAAAARESGARLIHVSTDFVFDGESDRAYHEWDAPRPLSVYGASKLAGEAAVWRSGARASVVRTQWLYGVHGRSFPRAILGAARRRPEGGLRVVCDQFGAPTFTRHLARKLAWLADWPVDGLYHVNNAGECSREAWARELLRLCGLEDVPVTPIRSEDWPAPAPRPKRSTLERRALALMEADDLPPWEQGLLEFVEELRSSGEL